MNELDKFTLKGLAMGISGGLALALVSSVIVVLDDKATDKSATKAAIARCVADPSRPPENRCINEAEIKNYRRVLDYM